MPSGPQQTARKKSKFLAALAEYGTIFHAAKAAGVSRSTVYQWQRNDPDFKRQVDDALEDNTEVLESSMYQRAIDGDTVAGIFLLKARRPEKYRERREVVAQQTTTHELRVAGIPREQLRAQVVKRLEQLNGTLTAECNGSTE